MNTPAFPLVQTKMRLPAARVGAIERPALVQRIIEHPDSNLVLVCAPAGYGKTTLLTGLSHTLAGQGNAVAWFSIDPEDDRENTFGAYLFESIDHAIGGRGLNLHPSQLIRSSLSLDLRQWMPSLINAVAGCGRNVVLVMDDYHFIRSRAVHNAVSYLIDHLPENMRLVIGTRSQPPIPLARQRARGRLVELRLQDLRFNLEETGKFLREQMKLDLNPETIRDLEERTEGWPAGLQLAALSMSKMKNTGELFTGFPSGHRFLVNYLIEEVFEGLPKEQREFLLLTAALDRMCAPLCDEALEGAFESGDLLHQLENDNLFLVPLDEEGVWWRYHHLFRDFLLTRAKKGGGNRSAVHRRACEWFARSGDLRQAAVHAFASGDWEFAAEFVEMNGFNAIIHCEIAALSDWCSRFPEDLMIRRPMLAVYQCWGWIFSFRKEERARIDVRLEQAYLAAGEDQNLTRNIHENEIIIRQMMAMAPDPGADREASLREAEEILKGYPAADAGQFSILLSIGYIRMAMNDAERAKDGLEEARRIALRERLLFGFIETSFHLARIFQMQGKLREAFEVCARTKAELEKLQGQDGPPLPGLGSLEIAAGCVLFEMNEISRAEEQLSRGLDMVGWGMNPYYFFIGNYCLYLLNQSLGQAEKAGLCLINLETAWPDISFLTRGLRIHADLIEHQGKEQSIERAAEWCRLFLAETGKLEKMPGFGPFAACEVYYQGALTWMRIQTLIGNGSQVYLLANEYLRCAQTGGLLDRQVELEMILLGLESKKESEEDMQRRNRTLTLAIEKGYFQKFILADISVEAIRKAAGAAIPRPTAEQLISICSTRKTVRMDQVSEEQPAVLLSSREKEIIRLLEKGETNQQIASVLFITVGTVKSHINHILTKLDAANRTQAVAKARALGFVEKDG